jgi:uncharacterized protein YjiK
MKNIISVIVLVTTVFLSFNCTEKKNDELKSDIVKKNIVVKSDPINSSLENYDIESQSAAEIIKLQNELKEISGITFDGQNRLFAHKDESATVYELDNSNGSIIKKFMPGRATILEGDFEDIAVVNFMFYLVKSNGNVYAFKEAENNMMVEYAEFKNDLEKDNDAEGLCFDSETNSLLIALKGDPGTGGKDEKAIYTFSLSDNKLVKEPRFIIPIDLMTDKEFSPSGIAKHPGTGNFFILSAQGNLIVEITKDGKLLKQKKLPKEVHVQPEGIAFDKNMTLYISNESKKGEPSIVKYKPLK